MWMQGPVTRSSVRSPSQHGLTSTRWVLAAKHSLAAVGPILLRAEATHDLKAVILFVFSGVTEAL